MNADRYRLVLNRIRGMLMAVAETAVAHGNAPGSTVGGPAAERQGVSSGGSGRALARLRPAVFAALLACGAQLALIPAANAQIVAYKPAPASQRPTVLSAGNGVPLVNIQTPSAAGVSRNAYEQFDVQTQGAILNNSRTNTQTQLGGWVQGNPWLATGTARVILNEVISANPSQLLGYVEVAGSPAQVVIANPAGVTCNGCGFINASRATLTTGTPLMNGGNLDGYRVEGGTIRIEGAGMDATRTGYTDLIARAVEINAGLWAQNLAVTAGANTVNADNAQATPIAAAPGSGAAPAFAIDVASLGGMYAGKISLVGTEAGVGVRNAGHLGASAGEVRVTVDGMLTNSGNVAAAGSIGIAATTGIVNSGNLYAGGDLALATQGDIESRGTDTVVAAAGNATLAATGVGSRIVGDAASLFAAGVAADGSLVGNGRLDLAATTTVAASGRHIASGDLAIAAERLDLADSVNSARNIALVASVGNLDLARATTVASAALSVHAAQTATLDDAATVAGALVIAAAELSNRGGEIVQTGAGDARIAVSGRLDNRRGILAGSGSLTLTADELDNRDSGQIVAGANLDLAAAGIDNRDGRIEAGAGLRARATDGFDNSRGLLRAGAALDLSADSLTNADTLGVDQGVEGDTIAITADRIDNRGGAMRADTALAIESGGSLDNAAGLLSSAKRLSVRDAGTEKALAIANAAGTLIAGERLELDAAGLVGGKLLSHGDLDARFAGDFGNSGELTANGRAVVDVGGTLTNAGKLQAGEALDVTAGTLDNRATGEILAPELRLAATAAHTLTNRGLIDGGNTRIDTVTLDNLGTGRIYGDRLAIAAGTLNNHAEGDDAPVVAARSRLDLGVGTLSNRDGALLFSAGELAIGGALDPADRATGRADAVTNASAAIEALGDLDLAAERLDNLDTHFRTAFVDTGAVSVQEYQHTGSLQRYAPDQVTTYLGKPNSDQWVLYLSSPAGTGNDWYYYNYTRRITETTVLERQAASIQSGGAMSIDAGTVVNDKSRLLAGGDLSIAADSVENIDATGQRTQTESGTATRYYRNRRSSGLPDQGIATSAYNPAPIVTQFSLAAAVYGGNLAIQGSGFNDTAHAAAGVGQGAVGAALSRIAQVGTPGGIVGTVNAPASLPGSALFRVAPDPSAGYLMESDPRFSNYRTWLSSDYMLAQLALDPAVTQKRLGDGFYEQRLVTEQVARLTGRRFLVGYESEEAQYRALLDAGVAYAQAWNLVPGVALSAEQMARLTTDMVWLVEKEVTLADGRVEKVLVPQVYARVQPGDLAPSGALIAGRSVDLAAGGRLLNEGVIAGRDAVSLAADSIVNRGGLIAGRQVVLDARSDIAHLGGLIGAQEALTLAAGRDIAVASATYRSESGGDTRSGIARLATLYAGAPTATLDLRAGGDIALTAARLDAGSATLAAAGDIHLGTVVEHRSETFTAGRYTRTESEQREVGTRIDTAGDLGLAAGGRLALDAAALAAGGDLVAQAGGDLSVRAGREAQAIAIRNGRGSLDIGQARAVESSLVGERVALVADRDLTVAGSRVGAVRDMTLAAGGDLGLATVVEADRNDWQKGDGRNWRRESASRELGSTLEAGGDIRLLAGNDLATRAADVSSAGGDILARAGRDLVIEAGEAGRQLDQASYRKKSGTFSSKTTVTRDTVDSTSAIASTFSGENVTLVADRDLTVRGSNVAATQDATLVAGENLTIAAATETHSETHFKQTRQSGLFGSGGFGITLGSRQNSTEQQMDATAAAGSTVGSVEGNVSLIAGGKYRQVGSDVIAVQGDIDIAAKTVEIVEARESSRTVVEQKSRQSGLTLAITSPIITALQTAQHMSQAAKDTKDGRMKALAAASAGLAGYNAAQKVAEAGSVTGGANLVLSLGGSKSSSKTTQTSDSAAGSTLAAGRDLVITASGGGAESSITLQGAQASAARNLVLSAEDEIRLLAVTNTADQKSKNQNASGSIGISIGTNTGFTVGASVGRGKADGDDLSHTNTRVEAGQTLVLESGGDTTLKGAVAKGERVVANVGGDLLVESLQDTSTYDSKQKSLGGSITIGVGVSGAISASSSKVKSDYASVVEQSAIRAGDGGFQVDVQGDTTLTGGAITSTQKAIDESINRLSTATLTTSDIANHASASASSSGFNLSSDMLTQGKYGLAKGLISNALNNANESESNSGQTRSVVSGGAIAITDEARQIALTGKTADQSVAGLNRDEANAQVAAQRIDYEAMRREVEAERAIKEQTIKMVTTFTDEAYRSRFQQKPQPLKGECPADANCIADPSKIVYSRATEAEIAKAPAGAIIAVNGILNDEKRAVELAYQNIEPTINPETGIREKPTTFYVMHIAPANNTLSELLGVAYEKIVASSDYGLANFLGYTNGQELYAELIRSRGQDATTSQGHSRGTLVQEAAFTILANRPDENGNVYTNPALTVRGFAGASNAVVYSEKAIKLIGDEDKDQVTYAYFSNDPVSVSAGGNPGVWTLKDLWQVWFTDNSMHSCGGTGAPGCTQVENPVPGGPQGTPDGNAKLIQFKGGVEVDRDGIPISRGSQGAEK